MPTGVVPPGWKEFSLGDVVEVHDSKRVPLNAQERASRTGPYPYYGANGQVDSIDGFLFDGEYILVAEDGGYFNDPSRTVAYGASGRFWVNNHAHVLKPKDGFDLRFVLHQLNTIPWMDYVSGTTRLKLTQAALLRVRLSAPPLAEQRHIVDRIDTLMGGIRRARSAHSNAMSDIGELKRTFFSKFFCGSYPDFTAAGDLPVSSDTIARMRQGSWESEAGIRKRTRYHAAEFTNAKPRHRVPHTWRWFTVDQLAYSVTYGSSAKTLQSSDVPVLRMGNIVKGSLDVTDLRFLPEDHEEFPELLLKHGDVLFNRTNSPELVGKAAVFKGQLPVASYASYLIRVRLAGLKPELLVAYLNSSFGRLWIKEAVTQQVGQANVNGTKLRQLAVPVPPLATQDAMVEALMNFEARLAAVQLVAQSIPGKLDRLEQSVLSEAFAR